MKNKFLFIALTVMAASPAFAMDDSLMSRVAVAPLVNETGDPSLGVIAHTAGETIGLTLRLIGKFKVETPDGLSAVKDLESARPSRGRT